MSLVYYIARVSGDYGGQVELAYEGNEDVLIGTGRQMACVEYLETTFYCF